MDIPSLHLKSRRDGFSLVEVVLAVGIIAFCLVALMGLLSVSMKSSRESTAATADSLLFQKVVNQLRVASIKRRDTPQAGQTGDQENRLPLPAPGIEAEATTFSVDEFNHYVPDGSDGAQRVVSVSVRNPMAFNQANKSDPIDLAPGGTGGQLAVVCMTIKPAHGPADGAAVTFSTELNLGIQ